MKNVPIPYLRCLILLTVFVGLLGSAKPLLLNKIESIKSHSIVYLEKAAERATQKPLINKKRAVSNKSIVRLNTVSTPISKPITHSTTIPTPITTDSTTETVEEPIVDYASSFQDHLAMQAELRLQSNVTYDGRYVRIAYPMGDVPAHIGVCTDVVIRSFRGLGIDLQQRVHEDMKRNFRSYPNKWHLSKPDTNIDHRRVPNLMTYFNRAGASQKITDNPLDYAAGDVVAWDLGGGLTHIGIVSSYVSELSNNPLIVHNIGAGPELNDMLFKHKIIGHYKYGDKKVFKQNIAEAILESLKNNPEGLVFN